MPAVEPIPDEIYAALRGSLAEAHIELEVAFDADPGDLVLAAQVQLKRMFAGPDPIRRDAAMRLGVLFGEQIVRRCGWAWKHVNGQVAVVAPDAAYAVYPLHYMDALAQDRGEPTLVLFYNMVVAGKLPSPVAGQIVALG